MGMEFNSKRDFAPPTLGIFSSGIQLSPMDSCSAVSCSFGVLTGEDEHTTYLAIAPLQGCESPRKHNGWELKCRDCGGILRRGPLLTGEMDESDVREETVAGNACGGNPGSMEARRYC